MNVIKTNLRDCVVIEPNVFGDDRGFFLETFQAKRYADLAGIEFAIRAGQSLAFIQRGSAWAAFSNN